MSEHVCVTGKQIERYGQMSRGERGELMRMVTSCKDCGEFWKNYRQKRKNI